MRNASLVLATLLAALSAAAPALARALPADLAEALRAGGLVLVVRHTHAPHDPPAPQEAEPGNEDRERQLDEAGKADAAAIGRGLTALGVRLAEVQVSPAFRARQTATYAGLSAAVIAMELGDNARSMAGVTERQARWLRERASTPVPGGGSRMLITHAPNLTQAFPSWGASVGEGELAVLRPGPDGPVLIGRIKPGDW